MNDENRMKGLLQVCLSVMQPSEELRPDGTPRAILIRLPHNFWVKAVCDVIYPEDSEKYFNAYCDKLMKGLKND